MKWIRNIFIKKSAQELKNIPPRIHVNSVGWGNLVEFDHTGRGYIKFDSGGGQLIRNWDHFLEIVEIIETRESDDDT